MDKAKLEMFVRIAQMENITDAAESLGYTQSAASHMLRALEKELGIGEVGLFRRSRTGVCLNEAGKLLLPTAKEILFHCNRLIHQAEEIRGGGSGVLRLACFSSAMNHWLPHILRAFRKRHPLAQVETMGASYAEVERWLRDGEADCCFCRMPTGPGIESFPLARDPLVAIVPQDHRLAQKEQLSLRDLQGENFIRPTHDRFLDVLPLIRQSGLAFHFRNIVHDYHETISLVASGMGVSVVPLMMADTYPTLICVRHLAEKPFRLLGIAVREKGTPALARSFVSITRELFEQQLLK